MHYIVSPLLYASQSNRRLDCACKRFWLSEEVLFHVSECRPRCAEQARG
jgi:hypothetical protein